VSLGHLALIVAAGLAGPPVRPAGERSCRSTPADRRPESISVTAAWMSSMPTTRRCRSSQRPALHGALPPPARPEGAIRTRLAPHLRAPRLDIFDVLEPADHLAARKQLPVVVAAVDTRDEAVDASPDVDGIVHDLPGMMMLDLRLCRPFVDGESGERHPAPDF
jgi:hypothetical protein